MPLESQGRVWIGIDYIGQRICNLLGLVGTSKFPRVAFMVVPDNVVHKTASWIPYNFPHSTVKWSSYSFRAHNVPPNVLFYPQN